MSGESAKPAASQRLVISQSVLSDQGIVKDIMESIITSMSDGVMFINREGEISLVNPALCDILEIEPEIFLKSGWAEIFFTEDKNDQFNQIIIDVIQQHICNYNRETPYITPSGATKHLMVTSSVLEEEKDCNARIAGILLVFNDITDIAESHSLESELQTRSRELALEKAEGLDRLARAVAHEIRNPVTTIGGLLGRLLRSAEPSSQEADYLVRALAGARRLETIVSQVRAYADLPAPQRARVDLGQLLAGIYLNYRPEATARGVNLSYQGEVATENQAVAWVDQGQVERVVTALLDNALDAMSSGGELHLGLTMNGDTAVISVADTGPGIHKEDLPYLFDPFFTTRADAVGMSLAICKRVAVEHGGDLSVETRDGKGAIFTLTLPPDPFLDKLDESEQRPMRHN